MTAYIARYITVDHSGAVIATGVIDLNGPGFDLSDAMGANHAYRTAAEVVGSTPPVPNGTVIVTSLVEAG
jgi:hypothetical protein